MSDDQSTPEQQPERTPGQQSKEFKPPFAPQGSYGYGGEQTLPNSTPVLIMGILSILTCCCYGFLGLIFGIIGLVLGNKDRALYREHPEVYKLSSYKNSNAGRICSIIGLIMSVLYIVIIIAMVLIFGIAALKDPEMMREMLEEMSNN